MEFEKLIYELKDGIGIITLNDPDNQNTVSGSIVDELGNCLDHCDDDPRVRAVVLRGSGKSFSAGGNIRVMRKRIETQDFSGVAPSMRRLSDVIKKLRNIRKPIIASVHGSAAGGGFSLILHCDFRIVTEEAKMILPFANLALIPDCAAVIPLINMIGVAKTTELLMTSKLLTGQEALEWGLVNKAVPEENLEEATMEFAGKLAMGPTLSYGRIKAMLNRLIYDDLEWELELESEYQQLLFKSEDHGEGVAAFLEKRKPDFRGR